MANSFASSHYSAGSVQVNTAEKWGGSVSGFPVNQGLGKHFLVGDELLERTITVGVTTPARNEIPSC
jgi:hypothetical protein